MVRLWMSRHLASIRGTWMNQSGATPTTTWNLTGPPYLSLNPLETATEEARVNQILKKFELDEAKADLDEAEKNAEPTFAPTLITPGSPEQIAAIEYYTKWNAVLLAELGLRELYLAYKQNRLASYKAALADPGLTWNNLFTAAGPGELSDYMEERWTGQEGYDNATGLVLSGSAKEAAGGEVLALGTEIVANSVIEILIRDKLPELEQEVDDAEEAVGTAENNLAEAAGELADILADSLEIRLWKPATVADVEAYEVAQDAYELAKIAADAADEAFYGAFTAEIDVGPTEPACDSPELLVTILDFCDNPDSWFEPDYVEDYDGERELIEAVINEFCGRAAQI
jgi:hypothetical protein